MKTLLLAITATGRIFLTTSCASLTVMARAEGVPAPLDDEATFVPRKPQPAYYALLPAVFPFDIVTFPAQFIYFQTRDEPLRR